MPTRSSLCLMATMVRERRISPVELVDAHFRQIARHNPEINAFVVLLAEEARGGGAAYVPPRGGGRPPAHEGGRHNPEINAFVVLLEEEAREAAKQAEAA